MGKESTLWFQALTLGQRMSCVPLEARFFCVGWADNCPLFRAHCSPEKDLGQREKGNWVRTENHCPSAWGHPSLLPTQTGGGQAHLGAPTLGAKLWHSIYSRSLWGSPALQRQQPCWEGQTLAAERVETGRLLEGLPSQRWRWVEEVAEGFLQRNKRYVMEKKISGQLSRKDMNIHKILELEGDSVSIVLISLIFLLRRWAQGDKNDMLRLMYQMVSLFQG